MTERAGQTRATWLTLALIWGSTWLAIKVGLEDLPPFLFAGIRFVIAVVPLLGLVKFGGGRYPRGRRDWGLLSLTGFLTFGASYGLVFWGEQYVSSGLTAVLYTTYPLFGIFFAHGILESEPMTARRVAGAVISLAGVATIFADQLRLDDPLALWGSIGILVSAASGAFSGVLVKRHLGHLDATVLTASQMLLGGVPLLLLGLAVEGSPLAIAWTPKAVFCLLYLALAGTSLAFVLWYRLLQRTQVTRAQVMPVLNTVVAVLLGWLVLGEQYGVRGALGAAAVLSGAALSLWRRDPGRSVSQPREANRRTKPIK